MKKKHLYIPPKIEVEELFLENCIANSSALVNPGNQNGEIIVEDWTNGGDLESSEEDSRW